MGDHISIYVKPFPVEDSVPMVDEIEWMVRRLRSNCSGGISRMRAEHLRKWLGEDRKEEEAVVAAGLEARGM